MKVAHNVDPTTVEVSGKGFNPTENPGIMPRGAEIPAGEKEVNTAKPESHSTSCPAKGVGSGY